MMWEQEGQISLHGKSTVNVPLLGKRTVKLLCFGKKTLNLPLASWAEHSVSSTALEPEGRGEWCLMQLRNTMSMGEPARKYTELEPFGQG